MARQRNTNRNGGSFDDATKLAVWNKGRIILGYSPNEFRRDACGATMSWYRYGDINNPQGWEIDHIKPVSRGGGDELANLQPLQWENNRSKADSYPPGNYCVRNN